MPERPFKLDLKPTPWSGGILDSNGEGVAVAHGFNLDIEDARRDWIIMCVNAHDRLAEFARRYRAVCEVERQTTEANGLDVLASSWAEDIREIDAALAGTNAFPDLVKRVAALEAACKQARTIMNRYLTGHRGLEICTARNCLDDALADPVMDAVCEGLAKDAGLELTE